MRLFHLLPDRALELAAKAGPALVGVPQRAARGVRTGDMARWAVNLYPRRKYRSMLLGAPSGGVSHIGSIAGAPFLTTHFLACFRDTRPIDDTRATLAVARRLASRIARDNPDLHAVAHFDPLHDRAVLIFINHVRVKMLDVHEAYRHFITRNLEPGGRLFVINCTYPWLQYRVRPRVSFQIGGLGGVPDREFIEGSNRIDRYLADHGSPLRGGWGLRDTSYPLEKMPESEWGLMPEFVDSVRSFARREGIEATTLTAGHPDRFGELALELHLEASRRDGVEPVFLFADCFNQLDPAANLRSRLLPLWLPYYCDNSFRYAERVLERLPSGLRILFTMHPSFAKPFDMVPLDKWIELFSRDFPPVPIGIDLERFPDDFSYVHSFTRDIRSFCRKHPDPVHTRLGPETIVEIAGKCGIEVS